MTETALQEPTELDSNDENTTATAVLAPNQIMPTAPTVVVRSREDEPPPKPKTTEPRPETAAPAPGFLLPASMFVALVATLVFSFTAIVPQAVCVATLTMCTTYFTLRVGRSWFRRGGGTASGIAAFNLRLEEELEKREQKLRDSTLKEVEKIRVFFEALLEKHVFRVHRDLRERESEVENLRQMLREAYCESGSSGVAEALPPESDGDDGSVQIQPEEEVTTTPRQSAELAELERIESGNLKPTIVNVRVRDLLKTCAEGFRDEAKSRGVKLTSRLGKTLGNVATDPVMLTRVMEELLDNALAFTNKKGSVFLSAALQGRKGNKILRIRIKDSGPGIAKKDQERIFDPFESVGSSEDDGTGLGLPLARSYTRLLGGDVTVESELRKGSTFCVELPTA